MDEIRDEKSWRHHPTNLWAEQHQMHAKPTKDDPNIWELTDFDLVLVVRGDEQRIKREIGIFEAAEKERANIAAQANRLGQPIPEPEPVRAAPIVPKPTVSPEPSVFVEILAETDPLKKEAPVSQEVVIARQTAELQAELNRLTTEHKDTSGIDRYMGAEVRYGKGEFGVWSQPKGPLPSFRHLFGDFETVKGQIAHLWSAYDQTRRESEISAQKKAVREAAQGAFKPIAQDALKRGHFCTLDVGDDMKAMLTLRDKRTNEQVMKVSVEDADRIRTFLAGIPDLTAVRVPAPVQPSREEAEAKRVAYEQGRIRERIDGILKDFPQGPVADRLRHAEVTHDGKGTFSVIDRKADGKVLAQGDDRSVRWKVDEWKQEAERTHIRPPSRSNGLRARPFGASGASRGGADGFTRPSQQSAASNGYTR